LLIAVLLTACVAPQPKAEVCFAPEEPCEAKLVAFVAAAESSLDVAIYDINLRTLVQALGERARRLTVRVVVDQRQSRGSHSLVGELAAGGVAVRYGHQRGIMHNKFVIRDGTTLETGSFNFTNHAAHANSENQLYLDLPDVVARYQGRFEKLWAEATPVPPS
jgi:phosphatidylserine/phosphatidylglycerophosphate/cardiolipin synthase-like enzyme